jgi:hypothetical protein
MNQALDSAVGFAVLLLMTTIFVPATTRGDSQLGDQQMERFLLKAEVTRIHMVVAATTNPMSVDLERKGETHRAAFKYGFVERSDPGNSEFTGADQPYLDSYKHEVAAYRLDRALDMHMVPVAVLRNVKTDGALIEWISDAYTEQELIEMGKYPSDSQQLDQQRAIMHLFDALILNVNRKKDEKLITPSDWKLHLIDHSRGFRTASDLPESFATQQVSLPRQMLENLERLEQQSLRVLLGDLLSSTQIETMLARRDKILAKIQADRQQYGDEAVFQD